jgi:hypothetical protein
MVSMAADANSNDAVTDDERLTELANELADGMVVALGPWVERNVMRIATAYAGAPDAAVTDAARAAGVAATDDLGPRIRVLLATDVDDQRGNPLQVARELTSYATGVLRGAGVPPVVRDAEAERQFPDDDYDLTPASFADLDPRLAEIGIAWGAAKAHVVLRRRRREGRR